MRKLTISFWQDVKKVMQLFLIVVGIIAIQVLSGYSATYYVSPGESINSAISSLSPGDTLILRDGTYTQSMNPGRSGTASQPITIKAENDGKAIIDGQNVRGPVSISQGTEYLIIEGIVARDSSGMVYSIQGTNNIFKRCSGHNADTDGNTHVWLVWTSGQSGPVVLEDCIGAGTGRKMIFAYFSANVTFRRCLAAWDSWRGADFCVGWGGHWPWGDAMEFYNTANPPSSDNIMENCIVYGRSAQWGFSLNPNDALAIRNKFLGCMSIKVGMKWDGSSLTWPCPGPNVCACSNLSDACTRSGFSIYHQSIQDCIWQDCLAWGCGGAALHHIIGPYDSSNFGNKLIRCTFKNCSIGSPTPHFGAGVEMIQESIDRFDEVTDCYIEDVSGGSAHTGGGAQIIKRYVDGVLTDEPLWPWPMESRVQSELGLGLTEEITSILGISASGTPVKLNVTAVPNSLPADGISTSEITAKVYDENDILVVTSNAQITFNISSGGGTLVGSNPVNASGGIATITYRSATSAGTATITATSSGLTQDSAGITLYSNTPPYAPTGLECNNMTNPTDLTDTTPDLSWTFNDSNPGDTQTAYKILVADSQSALDSNNGNMWDTNKVVSAQAAATYNGSPLQIGTMYYWKVMTWDNSDAEGAYSQTATFTMTANPPVLVSNTSWQSYPITSQNSLFTIDFDMVPLNNNMNGVTGLSNGPAGAYSDLAAIARFDTSGNIDIRNGGTYGYDTVLSYTAGTKYHVRMDINIPNKTYSVVITPEGGSAVNIATDYAFRSDQSTVSILDNVSVVAESGSHEIYNIVVNGEVPPAITVTAPNGGETWYVGDTKTVSWTSQGTVGNVNISLSTDGGTNWISLAANSTNDGQEQVSVPGNQSTTCRIRVQDVSGSPGDTSNSNFTITTPVQSQITVTVPNGGETWQAGDTRTVTWTSQGNVGNAVGISLSTDGGSSWTSLISDITNDGSQTITIPNSPSTSCKIRVQDISGSPSDSSNGNFTIEASPDPESISVNPTTLDFGDVEIGKTGTMDFTITNTGGGILSGTITTDKKWIEVQPTSFEGNSVTVEAKVDNSVLSQSEGQFTGIITITSNDPINSTVTIDVTLRATCVLVKPNPYDPTKGPLTFFGDGIVPGVPGVPSGTTIRIYTLSGELIKTLSGDSAKSRVFEGQEIQWRGTNENGEKITSGIYIYVYKSPKEQGVGKFTVINE